MGENELLVNKKKRNELIERIEILDSVGEILLLKGADYATQEMVANYYDVTLQAIESIVLRNRDELESDGFKTFKYSEIKLLNI